MASRKENFIVLKKVKYSESDLVLHALSMSGGKFSFIAKGALRSKKRFAGGVLEPTHYVTFSYKVKPNQEEENKLLFLEEANLINSFSGLRTDYDRLQTALYLVQLVDRISLQGDIGAEEVFNLLGNALKQLESSSLPELVKSQFEIKLLYQQGVLPQDLIVEPLLIHPLKSHQQAGQELGFPDSREFVLIKDRLQAVINKYVSEARTH